MRLTELLLTAISPTLMIPKREWMSLWRQNEFRRFERAGRALCLAMSVLYFLHYYLVDLPAHKQPIELWAQYRFSVAGLAILIFGLTFTPWFRKTKYYKFPLALVVAYAVYMQGQSMIWRTQVPFFYVPLIGMFGVLALRLPIIGTLLVYFSVLALAFESFLCRPSETQHMVSASLAGAVVLIVLRSKLKNELESFIFERKHFESQQILIETQLALTEQMRAFLPRELFRRVESLMIEHRKTPLQAVDEVLRPRKVLAAVLHSDIRGFTNLTKVGDEALLQAVFPAQKACTEVIEKHRGIPRLQGDLVFAYFDDPDPIASLVRALDAAIELSKVTAMLNSSASSELHKLRRYSILSFGQVIAGNLGGLEGSREITVLGNAANMPSRIDSLTKEPALQDLLEAFPVIVTEEAFSFLSVIYPEMEFVKFDVKGRDLLIRDFPEQHYVYLIHNNSINVAAISQGPKIQECIEYCRKYYGIQLQRSTSVNIKGAAA